MISRRLTKSCRCKRSRKSIIFMCFAIFIQLFTLSCFELESSAAKPIQREPLKYPKISNSLFPSNHRRADEPNQQLLKTSAQYHQSHAPLRNNAEPSSSPSSIDKTRIEYSESSTSTWPSRKTDKQVPPIPTTLGPNNQVENATQLTESVNQLESPSYSRQRANRPLNQAQLDDLTDLAHQPAWPLETSNLIGLPDWQLLADDQTDQHASSRALALAHQRAYLDAAADLYQVSEHPRLIDIFKDASGHNQPEVMQESVLEEEDDGEEQKHSSLLAKLSHFSLRDLIPLPRRWQGKLWWTTDKPKLAKPKAVTRPSANNKRVAPIITPVNFIIPSMSLLPATNYTKKVIRRQNYFDEFMYDDPRDYKNGYLASPSLTTDYAHTAFKPRRQIIALRPTRVAFDDDLSTRATSSGLVPSISTIAHSPDYNKELVSLFENALIAAVQEHASQSGSVVAPNSQPAGSSPTQLLVQQSNQPLDPVKISPTPHIESSQARVRTQPTAWISLDGRQVFYNASVPPSSAGLYLATTKKISGQKKRKPKIVKLANSQLINSPTDLQSANTVHHVKQLIGEDDDDDDEADVNVRLLTRASRATSPASLLISLAFLILSNVSLAATVIAHGISAILHPPYDQFNQSHDYSSSIGSQFPLFGRRFLFRRTTTRKPRHLDGSDEVLFINRTDSVSNTTDWTTGFQ